MKTSTYSAIGAAFLAFAISSQAQTPVSTGTIQSVDPKEGTLTIRTNQALPAPVTFYGMDKAKIQTVSGMVKTLADLQQGTSVTVQYAQREDRWYVSRVLLPDAEPAAIAPAMVPVMPVVPMVPEAARDGDRTTRPGQGAAGDITVQPPGTDPRFDGDRTTRPGQNAAADRTVDPPR